MKKFFKTLAALAVVAALGFGFVSCGDSGDDNSSGGGNSGNGGSSTQTSTTDGKSDDNGNSGSKQKEVTIKFLNDISIIESLTTKVKVGEKVTKPADLSYTGRIDGGGYAKFEGWYADSAMTTKFDFDAPIADEVIIFIYTKWTKIRRVARYNAREKADVYLFFEDMTYMHLENDHVELGGEGILESGTYTVTPDNENYHNEFNKGDDDDFIGTVSCTPSDGEKYDLTVNVYNHKNPNYPSESYFVYDNITYHFSYSDIED